MARVRRAGLEEKKREVVGKTFYREKCNAVSFFTAFRDSALFSNAEHRMNENGKLLLHVMAFVGHVMYNDTRD